MAQALLLWHYPLATIPILFDLNLVNSAPFPDN